MKFSNFIMVMVKIAAANLGSFKVVNVFTFHDIVSF